MAKASFEGSGGLPTLKGRAGRDCGCKMTNVDLAVVAAALRVPKAREPHPTSAW
jgi:hypothetical protein